MMDVKLLYVTLLVLGTIGAAPSDLLNKCVDMLSERAFLVGGEPTFMGNTCDFANSFAECIHPIMSALGPKERKIAAQTLEALRGSQCKKGQLSIQEDNVTQAPVQHINECMEMLSESIVMVQGEPRFVGDTCSFAKSFADCIHPLLGSLGEEEKHIATTTLNKIRESGHCTDLIQSAENGQMYTVTDCVQKLESSINIDPSQADVHTICNIAKRFEWCIQPLLETPITAEDKEIALITLDILKKKANCEDSVEEFEQEPSTCIVTECSNKFMVDLDVVSAPIVCQKMQKFVDCIRPRIGDCSKEEQEETITDLNIILKQKALQGCTAINMTGIPTEEVRHCNYQKCVDKFEHNGDVVGMNETEEEMLDRYCTSLDNYVSCMVFEMPLCSARDKRKITFAVESILPLSHEDVACDIDPKVLPNRITNGICDVNRCSPPQLYTGLNVCQNVQKYVDCIEPLFRYCTPQREVPMRRQLTSVLIKAKRAQCFPVIIGIPTRKGDRLD